MASVFDPEYQQSDEDSKLVAALERLSHVFRVLLWDQGKALRLSPIQIQFLIFLYYHPPEQCRVTELARRFQLTKPTVSDAISALESRHLLEKLRPEQDRRRIYLRLTPEGETLARRLTGWADVFRDHLAQFSPEEKTEAYLFLLRLIESLERGGVLNLGQMCFTCRFFAENALPGAETPHYCRLLEKPLSIRDVRIDCPEHELAS